MLDLALADSVMPLVSFALAGLDAGRGAPVREGELLNGGAARYRVYRCADGKFVDPGRGRAQVLAGLLRGRRPPGMDDPLR